MIACRPHFERIFLSTPCFDDACDDCEDDGACGHDCHFADDGE